MGAWSFQDGLEKAYSPKTRRRAMAVEHHVAIRYPAALGAVVACRRLEAARRSRGHKRIHEKIAPKLISKCDPSLSTRLIVQGNSDRILIEVSCDSQSDAQLERMLCWCPCE